MNSLSNREKQILKLISTNLSSEEIGKALNISTSTVSKHRENISKKLNLTGRNSLMHFAMGVEFSKGIAKKSAKHGKLDDIDLYELTIRRDDNIFEDQEYGVVVLDTQMRVHYINETFNNWIGADNIEVQGKNCFSLYGGFDSVCELCPVVKILCFHKPIIFTKSYCSNGGKEEFQIFAFPIIGSDQKVLGTCKHLVKRPAL